MSICLCWYCIEMGLVEVMDPVWNPLHVGVYIYMCTPAVPPRIKLMLIYIVRLLLIIHDGMSNTYNPRSINIYSYLSIHPCTYICMYILHSFSIYICVVNYTH